MSMERLHVRKVYPNRWTTTCHGCTGSATKTTGKFLPGKSSKNLIFLFKRLKKKQKPENWEQSTAVMTAYQQCMTLAWHSQQLWQNLSRQPVRMTVIQAQNRWMSSGAHHETHKALQNIQLNVSFSKHLPSYLLSKTSISDNRSQNIERNKAKYW